MTVKTLTITEEAYNKLKNLKKENQSFSQIIIEVAKEKKTDISKFFGILKHKSKELEEMRGRVEKGRVLADKMAREKERKFREILYDNS